MLFEKTQRPVAVSLGSANGGPPSRPGLHATLSGGESETETERENDGVLGLFGVSAGSGPGYPFPSMPSSSFPSSSLSTAPPKIEIARAKSSDVAAVPGTLSPSTLQSSETRVHLESVSLVSPSSSSSSPAIITASPNTTPGAEGTGDEVLKGTILVENVSFGKSVFVRFTLDEWQTTSEVGATYVGSLPVQSSSISAHARSQSEPYLSARSRSPSPGPGKPAPRQWDRFSFSINLSSVRHLHTRRLFLVVRYNPQSWGPQAEFWDNNSGKNYSFVFEREKKNPVSASPGVIPRALMSSEGGSGGLGLSGVGGASNARMSSMPVSPSASRFKAQMDAKEDAGAADLESAKLIAKERPVPRLPGVGAGIGKSASAPALALRSPHSPVQTITQEEAGRPRSGSADSASNYPAIQLKLSNYISPTTTRPAAPIARPPPISTAPTTSSSARVGAPLSPPDSPVADRLPSPPPSSTTGPSGVASTEGVAQTQPAREKGRLSTPPESANTSPEATLVPLPASSSSASSDSDRDSLRLRMDVGHPSPSGGSGGGNYYKRSMTHTPQYHAQQQHQRQKHRAPAPQGLDFASRFNHHDHAHHHAPDSSMGDAHHDNHFTQRHSHPRQQQLPSHPHLPHQHHHAKFTVGTPIGMPDSNSSSPQSSATSTPVQVSSGTSSPFDPTNFSTLSKIQTHGSSTLGGAAAAAAAASTATSNTANTSANPFGGAPAEFLQKFCFFGSPEPSPTHTHPPKTFPPSSFLGGSSGGNAAMNGPIMFGGEVLPSATVSMGNLSSALMTDASLSYLYTGANSGSASHLRADLRGAPARVV